MRKRTGEGGAGLALLRQARERLASLSDWTPETVNALLEAFATEKGLPNMGAVAQPLRVALTGRTTSPGIFDVLAVLGRQECLARLGDQAPA